MPENKKEKGGCHDDRQRFSACLNDKLSRLSSLPKDVVQRTLVERLFCSPSLEVLTRVLARAVKTPGQVGHDFVSLLSSLDTPDRGFLPLLSIREAPPSGDIVGGCTVLIPNVR
jgi:hypothetical protein